MLKKENFIIVIVLVCGLWNLKGFDFFYKVKYLYCFYKFFSYCGVNL